MKRERFLRLLLPLFIVMCPLAYAAESCDDGDISKYDEELSQKDWDVLYDYINTKRTINVLEKGCALTISGDVRADLRHAEEHQCERRLRGGSAKDSKNVPISNFDWDVAFNLRFDYVCGRAWAVAHFEMDNTAGTTLNKACEDDPSGLHGSGASCDLSLKKAYLGYNLCCNGCTRFDVEIGRRKLYQVFESNVQFLSTFDGVLLRYDSCFDCWGDYYIKLAGFVVDEKVNHYAWVTELAMLDICDYGIDIKYSFIDWRKNGVNRCDTRDPVGTKFLVSQWTFCYRYMPDMLRVPTKLYAAVLINHDATPPTDSGMGKEDMAWYAGFTLGEVVYACDWALDCQFQWVEAYSVPDRDMSGIGNGNVLRQSVYQSPYTGNTNFYGFRVQALYAFTDNLSLDTRFEYSKNIIQINDQQKHRFSQVRVEAIYAF